MASKEWSAGASSQRAKLAVTRASAHIPQERKAPVMQPVPTKQPVVGVAQRSSLLNQLKKQGK